MTCLIPGPKARMQPGQSFWSHQTSPCLLPFWSWEWSMVLSILVRHLTTELHPSLVVELRLTVLNNDVNVALLRSDYVEM